MTVASASSRSPYHRRFRQLLPVLAILLLAAVMRIGSAGHFSTWSDEGWNRWVVTDSTLETVFYRLAQNHHPPAYFLSLGVAQRLGGDNRLALRFPAILAGMLSVALIFRIGADHFGQRAGLFAGLLFAVFEQSVYYGQSMRHYGFLTLGVCLMLFCFLRILKQARPRPMLLIVYALSTALALLSMYLAVFMVAIQGLVGLILWRRSPAIKARLVAAWAGAGVILLPWLIYALPTQWHKVQRGVIQGYHNSFATTPDNVLMMSDLLLGGQFVIGAALVGLGLGQVWRTRQQSGALPRWTVALSGVGLFGGLLVVNLWIGILSERTLYFLLPGVLLVIGYGFQQLQPRAQGLIVAAAVFWLVLTPQNIIPHINSDLVAQQVAQGYNPGDLVLLETGFDDVAFEYELLLTLPPEERRVFRTYYEYDYPDDPSMLRRLNRIVERYQRVWLVYWNVPPRMGQLLETAGFSTQDAWQLPIGENDPLYPLFPWITLTLYTRPDPTAEPVQFGEVLELRDSLIADTLRPGQALQVDLWWTALRPPDRDYSVGVFLLNADGVTQIEHIGPDPATPVSRWQVGEVVFDRHTLTLPEDLPPGMYQVIANVYWWETVEPLPVAGPDGDGQAVYATLGTVQVLPR